MSGDALQIAGNVDMERAGLDALRSAFPKTPQMVLGRGLLQVAHAVLFHEQRARRVMVTQHEHAGGEVKIVEQALVHIGDFLQTFLREAEPLLDLLGSNLAQALVQDVADVLEVDALQNDDRKLLNRLAAMDDTRSTTCTTP